MIKFTSRIVCAGPTAGKTTLQMKFEEAGFAVIDTDDMISHFFPDWFENKMWRRLDEPEVAELAQKIDFAIGAISRVYLDDNADVLLFSNLWGERFRQGLGQKYCPKGKLPNFIFRENPEEIVSISESRGGAAIPLKSAQHWVKSALKYGKDVADKFITLKKGEFIADVLDCSKFLAPSEGGVPGSAAVAPKEKPVFSQLLNWGTKKAVASPTGKKKEVTNEN